MIIKAILVNFIEYGSLLFVLYVYSGRFLNDPNADLAGLFRGVRGSLWKYSFLIGASVGFLLWPKCLGFDIFD